ncbi:hypothetical protein FKM82_004771 [Ascaphus truei]
MLYSWTIHQSNGESSTTERSHGSVPCSTVCGVSMQGRSAAIRNKVTCPPFSCRVPIPKPNSLSSAHNPCSATSQETQLGLHQICSTCAIILQR